MAKATFAISGVYLTLVGLALMVFPIQFGRGAVPADAGPALVAFLRLLSGPFLGIAALNWLSRNITPTAGSAIVIANIVGFSVVTANDAWGVMTGEARDIAKLFLVVHLLFTCAFITLVRAKVGSE